MAIQVLNINSDSSGDGSGTTKEITGILNAIQVVYGGTPDAGTDVVITESSANGLGRTLLTLTNKIASAVFYPRVQADDEVGVAIAAQFVPVYLDRQALTVVVDEAVISTTNVVIVRFLLQA